MVNHIAKWGRGVFNTCDAGLQRAAVERYIQAAPLALAPDVPARVLHPALGEQPPPVVLSAAVGTAPAAQPRSAPAIMDID